VSVVVGSADESLRKLKADSKLSSIDFLFLDHVEDLCEQDFKVAVDELKLLKTGAVIVADNVKVPGAPEYRKYVRSREDLRSEAVKGLIMPGELEVSASLCGNATKADVCRMSLRLRMSCGPRKGWRDTCTQYNFALLSSQYRMIC